MGKNTTIVNKADGSSKELPAGNAYSVDAPSVVRIPVDHDRVKNAAREGDNLVLALDDGQSIVVENFFKTDAAGNYSDLVLEDDDGGLWWLKWGPEPGAYSFVPVESLDDFLPPIIGEGAGSISTGVAIGAAILAGLGAAAGGGGGGGGSNPPPPPPPDTTAPNAPTAAINADGTVVSGTAEAGSTVTVYGPDGTTVLGTGTAGTNGSYSITLSDPQTNGEDLTVRARDAAGNVSPPTAVEAPDLTAPEAPTAEISDDGTTVSGTAEPGSTVTITDEAGNELGSTVVGDDGTYEIPLDPPLTNGEEITVIATDPAGNDSDPTTATAPDTTPPDAPTAEVSDDGTTVSGTAEPGSTVTITDEAGNELGSAVAGDDGTYEIPLDPPLTNGEEVTATATDPAGNDSDPTIAVAPDTTDPAAPTADVNDTGTAVTGVAEPGSTVTVYGPDGTTVLGSGQAAPDTGEYSVTLDPALINGEDLTVTATDAAGNESDPTAAEAPDLTMPTLLGAETGADGGSVVLTYDEALDAANPPVVGDFVVTADGTPVAVTGVTVSGDTVTLTLATPVANGADVAVSYTDPSAGNDTAATQDLAGNDAASFTDSPVTNTVPDTTAPTLLSAATSADGGSVVLTYDEALDAANPPVAGDFVVTADGTPVAVTGVTVSGNTVTLTLATPVANGDAVTVSYTDPSAGNDAAATQDLAGNDAASFTDALVTNTVPDTTAPTLVGAETSADGSSVVLTYDEALDAANPPAVGDFVITVDGTPVAVTGVTVSGDTVTLTLATPVANGADVAVSYTDPSAGNDTAATQDLAGNDAASFTDSPVTNTVPDTTAPTLTITAADLNLAAGESTTITFQFSEAVTGFAEGDVGLAGGTLSGFTQVDADTWTATFTQTGTDAPTISVADGAFTDVAGNPGTGDTLDGIDGFTADTTAPVLVSAETSADGGSIVLTYDEALDAANPPAVGNFAVTADGTPVTITGVTVSGDTVTLTLGTPIANGEDVAVSYTDPAGDDAAATQDLAGNDAASLTGTTVTNTVPDTTAPTLAITAADLNLAAGESTTITFQFSEAVTGFEEADVTFAGGTLSGFTQVDADTWTATFTQAGVVAPTISVADGIFTDLAGNPGTGDTLDGTDGFGADITAPTLISAATSTDGGSVVLTYDEALDPANPPVAGDFTVMVNGVEVAVTGITVSGTNVTLTLATPVANGDAVAVSYTDPSAGNDAAATQDLAGNDAASFADNAVTNTVADTTAPTLLGAATSADGGSVVLTYDEALDAANPPVVGDFVVTADGTPVAVTGVTVSGTNVTLTLATPVASGDAVTISYTDPSAGNDADATQDVAGNDAASFTDTPVTNTVLDTTPPELQSAATSADGSNLLLTYDEALDPANPPVAGDFVVTVDGTPVAVTAVTVSGSTVILTLATPVANGDDVTVSYTDPSAGNDIAATQDVAGNDAVSFTDAPVTNTVSGTPDTTPPTLLGAATSTDGGSLVLTYDEALDPANPPVVGDFAVTADGTPVAVTGVTVSGNTVTLTLATPVANGDAVTVSYTDPSAGNDAAATQDLAGNDAASFTDSPVTNTVPDTTAPTLLSAATSADGGSVVLTYDEALDAANPPVAGDFVVTADGTPVAVTGVTVSGNTVTLTLATPVANGDAVTVSYTDPSAGNDAAATQDLAGNDAASLTATPVTNIVPDTTPPPVAITSAIDDAGSGTGLVADGGSTNDNQPTINGTTEPGSTVQVTFTPAGGGAAIVVDAVVNPDGTWSATPPAALADDAYTVTAVATDPVGNASLPSNAYDLTVDTSLAAVDDTDSLDMGTQTIVENPTTTSENVQVIGLLESDDGVDDAATFTVSPDYTGDVVIEINQTALVGVADAFRVEVVDSAGNVVYTGVTVNSLVGDVAGAEILGLTGDNTLVATLAGLPPGDYSVIVRNDDSTLTDLLDSNDDGAVSLQELGDNGVILGPENQALILDAVSDALGPLGPTVVALLDPLLDGLNGLPVDEAIAPITSVLDDLGLTGSLDAVLSAVADTLLSNTLTLLQDTDISITLTEYDFANEGPVTGDVIVDDGDGGADDTTVDAVVTHVVNSDGLGDDVPADNSPLTIAGLYGDLTIHADGSYTYTAYGNPNAIGQSDVFTYTLSDGVTSDTATLTIDLDGNLVEANDDAGTAGVEFANVVDNEYFDASGSLLLSGGLGQTSSYTSGTFVVADNMDVSGSASISVLIAALSNGELFLERETSPGVWTEVASDPFSILVGGLGTVASIDFSAIDFVAGTYRVRAELSGTLVSVSASVTSAVDVTYTDQYVVADSTDATGNLLDNDVTNGGLADLQISLDDGATYVDVAAPVDVIGDFGTLTVNPDGSYVYTPDDTLTDPNAVMTDVFNYQLLDSASGQIEQGTLTVTVDASGAGVALTTDAEAMSLLAADGMDNAIYVLGADDSVLALGDGSTGSPADTDYAILPPQDDELVQQLLQPTLSAA